MIRSLHGVAIVALAGVMAACSPYPGEGVVETRDIREKGDVEEITGKAFGVKEGATEAALTLHSDVRFIYDLDNKVWAHVTEGAPLPTLDLSYNDVDSNGVKEALALMIDEAKAKQEEVRQGIAEEVAELEAKVQEQADKRDEAKAGAEGYETAIADAKGAFEKSEAALQAAITAYNKAIAAPVTQLNALAKKQGLSEIPDYRNPLKSYRYSSFKDGEKPASCQRARNKFVVNMLDTRNQCLYFSLPSGYAQHDAEVTGILKASVENLESATAKLGERGGWKSDGTGAYANLSKAKKAYEQSVASAREKFGDNRRRAQIIRNAEQWMANYQQKVDQKSSDAEFQKQIGWTNFYPSDEVSDKFNGYRDAMTDHFLATYVSTLGDITKNQETSNGEFSLDGGYNHVVTVTDTLVDFSGRKNVLRHLGIVDLTDPLVQEADAVTVDIAYRDLDSRPRDESIEKMQEEVLDRVIAFAREQEKS